MNSTKRSLAEPVTDLKRVPIIENGEPLVDFIRECPDLLLDRPRFKYRREPYARASLATRLCRANASLPSGFRIAVLECWRAPLIQRRMYQSAWNHLREANPHWGDAHLRRVVNQFSAPMDTAVPPPHTTGGAVDLALVDSTGEPCDVQSPFEPNDLRGFFFRAKGLSDVARRHRDILAEALVGAGITNYPSEFWHWSYGDQGWAYRGHEPHALYGAITPDGWSPSPEDDIDSPLELVDTATAAS